MEIDSQLATLLALSGELFSTLELKPLLSLVLEKLRSLVQYDAAAIFIVAGDMLRIAASPGYGARTESAGVSVAGDSASAVRLMMHSRSPLYIADLRVDATEGENANAITDVPSAMIGPNVRSWLGAPLMVKDNLIGVLCLGHREAHFYDRTALHIVQIFADTAAIAISNALRYRQAQDLAAADERTRLAHTLHDSVTQTLFSANLIASALDTSLTRDPVAAHRDLEKLRRLIQGTSAQMRNLLLDLRPAGLIEEQLGILLGHLGQAMAAQIGIPIALKVEGQCVLPAEPRIALYRIAQEALNNVAKHAEASQVQIELTCHSGNAHLVISDNGRGFKSQSVPASHMGLSIMRERAKKIGAVIEISSRPGEGTHISVSVTASQSGQSHD